MHKVGSSISKIIIVFLILIVSLSILFLTYGVHKGNFDYALSQRLPKLIAIFITGSLIAFSTVLFQTVTNNRLLTPSIMGLDSFYIFTQTLIVFLLGTSSVFIVNKKINFFICVLIMVAASTFLFKILFKREKPNVVLIVLVGIILGTMFNSLSKFMQIAIDPNEYLILQGRLYASFSNVRVELLFVSMIIIIFIIINLYKDFKYLDVMGLGREHSINLGVDYDRLVKKFFIIVAICTSISTALVGPVTFLGLLVINITKQIIKTYKHSHILCFSILLSIFVLILGQFLLERVLKWDTPISVIINLIGGIYFIYLLLKERQ